MSIKVATGEGDISLTNLNEMSQKPKLAKKVLASKIGDRSQPFSEEVCWAMKKAYCVKLVPRDSGKWHWIQWHSV